MNEIIKPKFMENIILHIEDDKNWRNDVCSDVTRCSEIEAAYGGKISYIESKIQSPLSDDGAASEIKDIGSKMGEGPALVSVITAQVARTFLSSYLPGVIISDTSFPLNGKKVVEWICAHGYPDYALIGLSGTNFSLLEDEIKTFFGKGNSRYFDKGDYSMEDSVREQFYQQIIRNRTDNLRRYKSK